MEELEKLKRYTFNNGLLCREYIAKWNACKNIKDFVDLMLTPEGCNFVCKGIRDGWFIDSETFSSLVGKFSNGGYVTDKLYNAEFELNTTGTINASSTLYLIIDSNITIKPKEYSMFEVFIVGNSRVKIDGNCKHCKIFTYGNVTVDITKCETAKIAKYKE